MTRLLSICTSFRRPDMLKDMLKTFYETRSPGTDIIIRLHEDDPKLKEYSEFIEAYPYEIGPHMCMQECLNHYTFLYPEIPYRQIITDDARYITKGWDEILLAEFERHSKGWGYICGDDRLNDNWFTWGHPSMEIWSYKQAKLVGFAYPRTVKHRGLDSYTKELCAALGICPLVPEVIIRHLQGMLCPNPDEDLAWTNSQAAEQESLIGLTEWRNNERDRQVKLIKEAWNNENNSLV